jgi:hypothetical protein
MQEYQEAFSSQQDLALLKQALTGGQNQRDRILCGSFCDLSKQTKSASTENQYQKVMAQIYKSKL